VAITLHIVGLALVVLVTAIYLRVYAQRPSVRRLFNGLVTAVLLTAVLTSITTVLSREGNSTRLPLLFFLCTWSVSSSFRSARGAALAVAGLLVYFLALSFQHLYLATSSSYTDNPRARQRSIALANQSLTKQHTDLLPSVEIRPTWHTWLTELYVVQSPVGGEPPFGGEQEPR
jgi:hypothetical protein